MADTQETAPKKRGRPPKENKSAQENSRQNEYEFCTYNAGQVASRCYYGTNIFDYYTADELMVMVSDPMAHNQELRKVSLMLYAQNGVYTNSVDYMVAMPTLSRVIVPHGKNKQKNIRNKELMDSTLRMIKDKEFVRDCLWRLAVEGIAFYYFETANRPLQKSKYMTDYDVGCISEINEIDVNVSIISLPADYTQIVGRKNNVPVIAFNLDYFDTCADESKERKLRKYPKEIRDAYRGKTSRSNKGNWVVLDCKKTIVAKIRSKISEPWGRPMVLAAINDILYSNEFTDTKRNILSEINNRIIYQTLPEGRDKGTCALTKTQQERQHNAVKNAVMTKNNRGGVSFFTVSAGTKIDSIDTPSTELFDEKTESDLNDKIAMSIGMAGSLINGVGSGSYSSQQLNMDLVSSQIFSWIELIESELNKCINVNIIKDPKNYVECRYLRTSSVNQKNMVSNAKELYLQGKGSLSLWAAACGVEPEVFYAMLDNEIEMDVENKYPVHKTSFNTSGNSKTEPDNQGGRPTVDDSLNDNTQQSKANHSNDQPKPSTSQ